MGFGGRGHKARKGNKGKALNEPRQQVMVIAAEVDVVDQEGPLLVIEDKVSAFWLAIHCDKLREDDKFKREEDLEVQRCRCNGWKLRTR